jgi:hypothetical protein
MNLLLCYLQERLPELVKLRGRVVKSSRNLARYKADAVCSPDICYITCHNSCYFTANAGAPARAGEAARPCCQVQQMLLQAMGRMLCNML